MFCPKCAAQNIDGASFCRSCGANISLVPQALTGQPAAVVDESRAAPRSRGRYSREATIEHALKNVFVGIAFLFVALALAWSGEGRFWWYWLLIPAFSSLGKGIAEYSRLKGEQKKPLPLPGYVQPQMAPPRNLNSLPARNTGEMVPSPPSVTEGTTRHLGAEAPTRHLDSTSE
jgi:hypothetical protein